jgi:hypothetical protein
MSERHWSESAAAIIFAVVGFAVIAVAFPNGLVKPSMSMLIGGMLGLVFAYKIWTRNAS